VSNEKSCADCVPCEVTAWYIQIFVNQTDGHFEELDYPWAGFFATRELAEAKGVELFGCDPVLEEDEHTTFGWQASPTTFTFKGGREFEG